MTIETIHLSPTLRVRIEHDEDASSPDDGDQLGQIAYCSSRECLGSENVSRDRLDEISAGIRDGSLIGMPVYAYVHSGVTIATTPFSCPWDSGQCGFVYMTKAEAIKEWGKKVITPAVKEKAMKYQIGRVDKYCQYLQGDVYGYVVERFKIDKNGQVYDVDLLESCWGMYGRDYAISEGGKAGAWYMEDEVTA
jgi:hypothetical protein